MKICPKCRESIGETLQVCPLCNYQFTAEETERFKREKEESENSEARHLEELRSKRAKMRVIFSIVMMSFYLLPYMMGSVLASMTGIFNIFIAFAVAGMVIGTLVMITGIISGAFRCPFCDRILFMNYGKHCHHCGKQLYY